MQWHGRPLLHLTKWGANNSPLAIGSESPNTPLPFPVQEGNRLPVRYFMLGHLQPLAQSSQHLHLQLQFGQSLQQSSEQQAPSVHTGAALSDEPDWLINPAESKPAATNKPPKNLIAIVNSLS